MRPAPNAWPTTQSAEDILFFAQLMREMLTPDTFESFRAMSLDPVTRLKECRAVLIDAEKGRTNPKSVAPFIDETVWSISDDPIIREIAPGLSDVCISVLTNAHSSHLQSRQAVEALRKKVVGSYRATIQRAILGALHQPNRRNYLRRLTSAYCSHVANSGYTRPYMLSAVKERFFSRDMNRVSDRTVASFFRLFDEEPHKYVVYVPCSTRFRAALRRIRASTAKTSEINPTIQPAFTARGFGPNDTFVLLPVEALDPFDAGNSAETVLGTIQTLNSLGPQADDYTWSDERFVMRARASRGEFLVPPAASPITHRRTRSAGGGSGLRSVVNITMGQFDKSSMPRLLASLNTSDISEKHASLESRFISLWSAIEVLVGDPPPATPRITHYLESIAPCICLRYMRRQSAAIFDELQFVYRNSLNKIIRKEPDLVGSDFHSRFAAILMLKKNAALRQELLALCDNNPLARHRLYVLWTRISKPDQFIKAIKDHEKLIRWQIARIYRVRNTLVHAGQRPSYTDMLVRNLFEYYSSTVWTILNKARGESQRSSLPALISEIGLDYQVYCRMLASIDSGGFSITDVERLLMPGR